MTKHYGIYEGRKEDLKFTGKFAVTSHEAQEWCYKQALVRLNSLTSETTPEPKRVLWFGELPTIATAVQCVTYLTYGKPGPNKDLVHITRFTKSKSWVGGDTLAQDILFSIECREITRVSSSELDSSRTNSRPTPSPGVTVPKSIFEPEIVQCGIATSSSPKRDLTNPRELLLSSIEQRRKD